MTHFSIGEFSKATGLPAKTLRFYHDKGLLIPSSIDTETGYRFYDQRCFDRAQIIIALKKLEFSLEEIAAILSDHDEDADILDHLSLQKERIAKEIAARRNVIDTIDGIIAKEKEERAALAGSGFQVEEKEMPPLLIAGVRMTGKYSDCGKGFGVLGRKLGRKIAGQAMCLYHDGEYREDDANFEPCFPVSSKVEIEGVDCRELPAGKAICLMHKGPYERLGRSYAKAMEHLHAKGLEMQIPSREIYHKGPGMIFKGNPKNYLTEIALPVEG